MTAGGVVGESETAGFSSDGAVGPASSRRRLGGVELAVLIATEEEMAPVLDHVVGADALSVGGKRGWLAQVGGHPGAGAAGRAVACVLLASGYGAVNAAHALTCVLEASRPRLVLQLGVGGAFCGAGLEVGDLALASSDSYAELGVLTPEGWISSDAFSEPLVTTADGREVRNTFLSDPALVDAAARVLRGCSRPDGRPPRVECGPFVTSDRVTGVRTEADLLEERWHALVESMEGAAAAHVCALYGVPFLQVRGISNLVVDRDRDSWRVEQAAAAAGWAGLLIAGALDEILDAAGPAPAVTRAGAGLLDRATGRPTADGAAEPAGC